MRDDDENVRGGRTRGAANALLNRYRNDCGECCGALAAGGDGGAVSDFIAVSVMESDVQRANDIGAGISF